MSNAGATLEGALRCPRCHASLKGDERGYGCPGCGGLYPSEGGVIRLLAPETRATSDEAFYSAPDPARYGRTTMRDEFVQPIRDFVSEVPPTGIVLEIGSGGGALDGVHPGYVASDFSFYALREYSTGVRVQADATALPFRSGSLDAVFTRATLEHVPDPAAALSEIARCLKPGGRAFVYPAWYVRPWASGALHVRPWNELSAGERARKVSIPLRDSRPWWLAKVLPGRIRREIALRSGKSALDLDYWRLTPNFDRHVVSDSDAYSSMDPQAVAAFFLSRGYRDLRRPAALRRLLYGHEPVIVARAPLP